MFNPSKQSVESYLVERLNGPYRRKHSEIAEKLDINQSAISRFARGLSSPTLKTVQPLLDFFMAEDKRSGRRRTSKV